MTSNATRESETMEIIRAENGTHEHKAEVDMIEIPDLWHVAQSMRDNGDTVAADMIEECWHLAHDMRGALRNIGHGADIAQPIHTK